MERQEKLMLEVDTYISRISWYTVTLVKISEAPANILHCTAFLFNYFTPHTLGSHQIILFLERRRTCSHPPNQNPTKSKKWRQEKKEKGEECQADWGRTQTISGRICWGIYKYIYITLLYIHFQFDPLIKSTRSFLLPNASQWAQYVETTLNQRWI